MYNTEYMIRVFRNIMVERKMWWEDKGFHIFYSIFLYSTLYFGIWNDDMYISKYLTAYV